MIMDAESGGSGEKAGSGKAGKRESEKAGEQPEARPGRRPMQLCGAGASLFALANDGSVWLLLPEGRWRQMLELPA